MVAILGQTENDDGLVGTTGADDKSGVFGRANSQGWGVFGFSERGYAGVFGSGFQNGIFGQTNNREANGVYGKNDGGGVGVFGQSLNGDGAGVLGRNEGSGWGVHGHAEGAGFAGVFGSGTNVGVFGLTGNGDSSAVHGRNNGANPTGAWGVFGLSPNGFAGVFGSGGKNGVFGQTNSANDSGVYGLCNGKGNGVAAISDSGTGVYAKGARFAGFFEGNVAVTGNLVVKGTDISALVSQIQSLGNLLGRVQGLEARVQTLEQENQRLKQEVAALKSQSPGGKLPAGSPNPQISVTKKDGKFVVTGSGFLANKPIAIRAVVKNNSQLLNTTSQSSDSDGSLNNEWSLNCTSGTLIVVSASDGRVISGKELWSNFYEITC